MTTKLGQPMYQQKLDLGGILDLLMKLQPGNFIKH